MIFNLKHLRGFRIWKFNIFLCTLEVYSIFENQSSLKVTNKCYQPWMLDINQFKVNDASNSPHRNKE